MPLKKSQSDTVTDKPPSGTRGLETARQSGTGTRAPPGSWASPGLSYPTRSECFGTEKPLKVPPGSKWYDSKLKKLRNQRT